MKKILTVFFCIISFSLSAQISDTIWFNNVKPMLGNPSSGINFWTGNAFFHGNIIADTVWANTHYVVVAYDTVQKVDSIFSNYADIKRIMAGNTDVDTLNYNYLNPTIPKYWDSSGSYIHPNPSTYKVTSDSGYYIDGNRLLFGNLTKTYVGYNCGTSQTGNHFSGLGSSCGMNNEGIGFVGIGTNTGVSNKGANFSGVGINSGYHNTGNSFIGIGPYSGYSNSLDSVMYIGIGNSGANDTSSILLFGRQTLKNPHLRINGNIFINGSLGLNMLDTTSTLLTKSMASKTYQLKYWSRTGTALTPYTSTDTAVIKYIRYGSIHPVITTLIKMTSTGLLDTCATTPITSIYIKKAGDTLNGAFHLTGGTMSLNTYSSSGQKALVAQASGLIDTVAFVTAENATISSIKLTDSLIIGGLIYLSDTTKIADDDSIYLKRSKSGWGSVYVDSLGYIVAWCNFYFNKIGTPTLINYSSRVVASNTDGNAICLYAYNSGLVIRNRSGAIKKFKTEIKY